MSLGPRVLVVGAGGIGGLVAASLTGNGLDVTAVSTNPAIRDAITAHGFRVRDLAAGGVERRVPGRIVAAPERTYDVVLLCTQPPSVEEAARSAAPHLADDGVMVVLQNGLCEERVAAIVGADRVIGAIVGWGASMPAPGVYERTAPGGFTVGGLHGVIDDPVREVGALLESIGPVRLTDNLAGARWSKLAINCAISSLGTIAGERLGPLVQVARYRRAALEIMTEAVEVAHAHGVRLEKVSGTIDLAWTALNARDRGGLLAPGLAAKHALLVAIGTKYRRMRSSMLSAIERGRIPAIDFLCGEVVRHGQTAGVKTPWNADVVHTVWQIAGKQQPSSRATLDALCRRHGLR